MQKMENWKPNAKFIGNDFKMLFIKTESPQKFERETYLVAIFSTRSYKFYPFVKPENKSMQRVFIFGIFKKPSSYNSRLPRSIDHPFAF